MKDIIEQNSISCILLSLYDFLDFSLIYKKFENFFDEIVRFQKRPNNNTFDFRKFALPFKINKFKDIYEVTHSLNKFFNSYIVNNKILIHSR